MDFLHIEISVSLENSFEDDGGCSTISTVSTPLISILVTKDIDCSSHWFPFTLGVFSRPPPLSFKASHVHVTYLFQRLISVSLLGKTSWHLFRGLAEDLDLQPSSLQLVPPTPVQTALHPKHWAARPNLSNKSLVRRILLKIIGGSIPGGCALLSPLAWGPHGC